MIIKCLKTYDKRISKFFIGKQNNFKLSSSEYSFNLLQKLKSFIDICLLEKFFNFYPTFFHLITP